jgi:nitroimidazol reductase NimA-like FMN-containing flavoprotein (pyridoxamine 5'-phosphate oxidase superfamily)
MSGEPAEADDRTLVRRKDRQVTDDEWIKEMLRSAPAGTLATVTDGQPFVNMNLFVYCEPEHAIYTHTARTGRTRTNVEGEERVCFSLSTMGRLLPADTALEMSVEYAGVVVFGKAAIVEDEAEARRALGALLEKYFPHLQAGRDFRTIQPEELARTTVYRVRIEAWSGKRKVAPPDFRGAFLFGRPPARPNDAP